GHNTDQIIKYGFVHFRDLFNERQLLVQGMLLKYIIENIKDTNIKEFFLLAFSAMLEWSNSWGCLYETHHNKIGNAFSKHAFHPRMQFIENNISSEKIGGGTFYSRIKHVIRGKLYCEEPYERYLDLDTKKIKQKRLNIHVSGRIASDFKDLLESKNVLLLNGSSEIIEIPAHSADVIVTDPPYADSVNYSELYDYFHVWLRLGLKDIHEPFRSKLTPKTEEIVRNVKRGKNTDDYYRRILAVFKQCHEKLKNEGLMVFTFHHGEISAWISIAKAILESNFIVVNSYVVHAEMKSSVHIHRKSAETKDLIIVCRKKLKVENHVQWAKIQKEILDDLKSTMEKIGINVDDANRGVLLAIITGSILKMISPFWPNIYRDSKKMDLNEIYTRLEELL
ncbi:MAG: DNA methyltransferase, partial [Promethearchaeota archaeon]